MSASSTSPSSSVLLGTSVEFSERESFSDESQFSPPKQTVLAEDEEAEKDVIEEEVEEATVETVEEIQDEQSLYKFKSEDENFKIRSPSIVIDKEKNQAVSQSLYGREDKLEIVPQLEPFAQECMHLFNGEWKVMKYLDNLEKQDISPHDVSHLLCHNSPHFDILTKRNQNHPLTLSNNTNVFVKCHSLHLDHGNAEPFYCSLELVNIAKKQQVSERFYFHLNTYEVINDFLDDFNFKGILTKFQKEELLPKAIFSVSLDESEDELNDIYLILRVEKTFAGLTPEALVKQYSSNGMTTSSLEQQCTGLKSFTQPFLFAFMSLFECGPQQQAAKHRLSVKLNKSPLELLAATTNSSSASLTSQNPTNSASFIGKPKLKEGPLIFKNLYCSSMVLDDAVDIFDIIQQGSSRDGVILKSKTKIKQVAGYCLVETSTFDAQRFESNAAERILHLGGEEKNFNLSDKPLNDAITAVQQRMEAARKKAMSASETEQQPEAKVYLKHQVTEFINSIPKSPYFSFQHSLYLYPEFIDLTKCRLTGADAKMKPRNILIQATFMEKVGTPSARFVQRFTRDHLVHTVNCNVQFEQKAPRLTDELKIVLPLPVLPSNHILFKIYHIHTEKTVQKRRKMMVGESAKMTLFGHAILSLSDIIEKSEGELVASHQLPVLKPNIPEDYLTSDCETFDAKKNVLRIKTNLMSTIYPREANLSRFFKECSPFLNAVDPNKKNNIRFVANSVNAAMRALKDLKEKIPVARIVSHLPLVMDMLFSIICRSPDILNNFVNAKQPELPSVLPLSNLQQNMSPEEAELMAKLSAQYGGDVGDKRKSKRQSMSVRSSVSITAAPESLIETSPTAPQRKASFANNRRFSRVSTPITSVSENRKSRDLSAENRKSEGSMVKGPQPGDPNFDLKKFLMAQEKQQQEQEQQEKQQEKKSSRRMSLFGGLMAKKATVQKTEAQPLPEDTKSYRGSNSVAESEADDFSDFINVNHALYDLQKEAFTTLVTILKGVCILKDDPTRGNGLLTSYVQFAFKDVIMTTSPVCYVVSELWSEVISRSDNALVVTVPAEPKSNPKNSIRISSPETDKASGSYLSRTTALSNSGPLHLESLHFSWFLFDVIIKSYITTSESVQDGGYKFQRSLKELVKCVASKVCQYRDDFSNVFLALALNQQVTFFLRDLFDTNMKSQYVFELIESYLSIISKEKTTKFRSATTVKLRCEFIHILSDHPNFFALNNELYYPAEIISIENPQCCPPMKLLVNVIKETIVSHYSVSDLQNHALDCIQYILTKHDYDKRFASKESRAELTRLYFPYVLTLLKYSSEFLTLESSVRSQHAKCLLWLLYQLDRQDTQLVKYFQKYMLPLMKLLAVSVDAVPAKSPAQVKQRTAFAESLLTVIQELFSFVTDLFQNNLKQQVEAFAENEKRHTTVLNFIGQANVDTTSLEYAIYTITMIIMKLGEHNVSMTSNFVTTVKMYINILMDHFKSSSSSVTWKWLYGSIIHSSQLPMATGDSVNKSQLQELKQFLEQPYEVLSMDGLQPLVVVPDSPENIDYEQVATLSEEASTAGSHSSLSPTPTGVQQDLRGATMDKLVEKLTHHEQSVIFQQIFFLTYRSFSSPSELLLKLVQRFIQLKQLEQAQIAESAHANRMLLRLWGSLKRWLDEHYYDFDNELVASYVNFLNEYAVENLNLAVQLKKKLETNLLFDKQQQNTTETLSATTTKPNIPKPVLRKLLGKPEEVDITEIDPLEIAKQITLIEHDIFRNIRPKECFKNAWNKKEKEKLAPNIVAIINRFNAVSTWTATLILQGQDQKRRAKLIGHFIKVAKHCKDMNNLNAMNSIVSALNNAAVHRLQKSWALLSKQRVETFQQLCALVSMEGAYKNMREHLRSIAPPLVPYIGIYLTDLTFMEDGNPDFVKPKNSGGSTPTELKLINFTKRRKIARIIMDIRTLQGGMYNFPQVHALHKYLMKCEPRWGDSQLFNQSLKVEPREARQ